MLVITSRSHIDEGLKFSFDHISEIAKDSFYLKYESAFISDTADYTKAPCYIVLPYGLASILKGASVAIIKGYGLKKCESDESHCFVYEATPNDDEEKSISLPMTNYTSGSMVLTLKSTSQKVGS